MNKYLRIMRIDHWVKQLFILPGVAFAILLVGQLPHDFLLRLVLGFASTCLIASANYVINEWLDAEFDRFHPVKKHRSVVENDVKKSVVYIIYAVLTLLGFGIALLSEAKDVFWMELWLWQRLYRQPCQGKHLWYNLQVLACNSRYRPYHRRVDSAHFRHGSYRL